MSTYGEYNERINHSSYNKYKLQQSGKFPNRNESLNSIVNPNDLTGTNSAYNIEAFYSPDGRGTSEIAAENINENKAFAELQVSTEELQALEASREEKSKETNTASENVQAINKNEESEVKESYESMVAAKESYLEAIEQNATTKQYASELEIVLTTKEDIEQSIIYHKEAVLICANDIMSCIKEEYSLEMESIGCSNKIAALEKTKTDKEEDADKNRAIEEQISVLNTKKDTLTEKKETIIETRVNLQNEMNDNIEALQIERENLDKVTQKKEEIEQLLELTALWDPQLKSAMEEYNNALKTFDDLKAKKLKEAVDIWENKQNELAEIDLNIASKKAEILEKEEEIKAEQERKAAEEAAAAAAAQTTETAATAITQDISTDTGTAAATTTAADTGSTDGTTTATSERTSTASSSSAAQTQSARQEQVQQVQSSQQLSSAQTSADRVLSSASKDLDDLFDGNVNSLKRISSDKAAAYDGFISKLETLDESAAKAISDKKAELDEVDSDYREVKRDMLKLETSMTTKETYLSIANTELESLKDAQSELNKVDTTGLNDSQKETLKELKTDVAKAIQKKEEEIDRLSDAENSMNALKAKESELKEQRTKLRGELKEMMADAADLYSADAPDLKSYSGSYNKLVNDYDREESAKETEIKTSLKEESDNINKYKDDKLAEARKFGDKYKFDPDA